MRKFFNRDKTKPVKPNSTQTIEPFPPPQSQEEAQYYANNVYVQDRYQYAQDRSSHGVPRTSSDEHWDVISSHDGSSPVQSPYVPRAVSPFGANASQNSIKSTGNRDPQMLRKKPAAQPNPAAALGILRALDPHHVEPQFPTQVAVQQQPYVQHPILQQPIREQYSEDTLTEPSIKEEKKEKKGFWERASGRDKEKDKDRDREKEREREREKDKERERDRDREGHREDKKESNKLRSKDKKDDDGHAELTRMIGYVTATQSEDWALVLEICERAGSSEASAKETVKALRREFKYAEPPAQLSAARLWAILLRNASQTFVAQCSSRKFLDTLDDTLSSSRTSPVVKERLLQVLAAAAYYTSPTKHRHELRALWKRHKEPDQPEEGIPFDPNDAMLNPPTPKPRGDASPQIPPQRPPITPNSRHKQSSQRIIPPEEDRRRLLQECKVGRGNAALLSEALAFAKPEDLKQKPLIQEFYARCRASQELIFAQIPWASAGAERSRAARDERDAPGKKRRTSPPRTPRKHSDRDNTSIELTQEEQLLAALLSANEELTEALKIYDDLERMKVEKETEERSKRDTRMRRPPPSSTHTDSSESSIQFSRDPPAVTYSGSSPEPSPSPSPEPSIHMKLPSAMPPPVIPSLTHPLPPLPNHHIGSPLPTPTPTQTLAPPPPAPHGPRYPSHNTSSNVSRSRSPSPEPGIMTPLPSALHNHHNGAVANHREARQTQSYHNHSNSAHSEDAYNPVTPVGMSEKALGKRRQTEPDEPESDHDDGFQHWPAEPRDEEELDDLDSDTEGEKWKWRRQPVHYVYDAAAERTEERIRQGRLAAHLVGGVH
ncbi:hypothetical protein C8Q75DRAFT_765583 [Abortiporus biennis]|nr:hypothetical protein C8Q75DRAFT_765583 [Abortiporus biennis]